MKLFLLGIGFLIGIALLVSAFLAPHFWPEVSSTGQGWVGIIGAIVAFSAGSAIIDERN